MIGTELVSLVSYSKDRFRYREIWNSLLTEPGHERFFGPMSVARSKGGVAPPCIHTQATTAILFAIIAGTLVLDTALDSDEWNPVNVSFFVVLLFLCMVGIAASFASFVTSEDNGWKIHRFLIKLGEKIVGVGDIHQDVPNAVCNIVVGLLPQFRGNRTGSIATRMMIRKSFTDLGARRVESSALATNPASLNMNDRMVQEGVLRERVVISAPSLGIWRTEVDEVLFRLMRSEWDEQNREKSLRE